ncbi:hypothetical protein GCM10008992_25990 [Halorubrum aquaticum]
MLPVDIDDGRPFRRCDLKFSSAALDLLGRRPLSIGEQLGELLVRDHVGVGEFTAHTTFYPA